MQRGDMVSLRALVLELAVLDHGVVAEGELSDGIREGRRAGEADIALDDGELRAAFGDDEAARARVCLGARFSCRLSRR